MGTKILPELKFIKVGKEYAVYEGEKEVGKMFKDNKRNYQFSVVVRWNFKVRGYKNEAYGKTYKEAKMRAMKMYGELMDLVEKRGKELVRG